MIRILIMMLVLAGCSGCGSGNNSTTTLAPISSCSRIPPSDTCVSIETNMASVWPPEYYEQSYRTASECMVRNFGGRFQSDPAPTMQIVNYKPFGKGGWTDYTNGQIAIFADAYLLTVHESIHYLLWREGLNPGHDNPAFTTCDPQYPGSIE
jgi:hypothetical protein